MNTKAKQINLADIVAVAGSFRGKVMTHSQRLLSHSQEHGIESLMIFETMQDGSLYWLVGQKVEKNKWSVSLIDPKGTFRSSMGEKTDDEFIAIVSDVDANAKATLTVEALDLVPITLENIDFKYKHLSKKVEKKMNKIWPF